MDFFDEAPAPAPAGEPAEPNRLFIVPRPSSSSGRPLPLGAFGEHAGPASPASLAAAPLRTPRMPGDHWRA